MVAHAPPGMYLYLSSPSDGGSVAAVRGREGGGQLPKNLIIRQHLTSRRGGRKRRRGRDWNHQTKGRKEGEEKH